MKIYDIMKSLDRPEMKPANLRRGQYLYNLLYFLDVDIACSVTGTDADCFYDDRKIPAFFSALSCSTDSHDLPEITGEIEKLQSSLKQTITRMLQEYLSVSPEIQAVVFSDGQAYTNIKGFTSQCKDSYILNLNSQWVNHGNGDMIVVKSRTVEVNRYHEDL